MLQNVAFKKAKEGLKLHAPILNLPASSEQGTRSLTKRKTPEVEEVDPTASTIGAKPFGKKLIKTLAKKSTAKKPRDVEITPDTSIIKIEFLENELNDATILSTLIKSVNEQKQILGGIIEAQEALETEDRRVAREHEEARQFVTAS